MCRMIELPYSFMLLLESWGVNLGFMDLFIHYICIFLPKMETSARQDDGEKAAS